MRQEDLISVDEWLSNALMAEELSVLADDAFDETINATVRSHEGDAESIWEELTEGAYDPRRVLCALRDHHDADHQIDPLALMETFMESYDYGYAHHARFVIGNIVGHRHMSSIQTRGRGYWQRVLGNR